MRFRNYCIVGLGIVDGIIDEVKRISETDPRVLPQKGVVIATFSSVMEPSELRDFFNKPNRTFFIFEVDEDISAYHIGREDIHERLFGYIEDNGEEVLNMMTEKLMGDIRSSGGTVGTSGSTRTNKSETKAEIVVSDLSEKEAEKIVNDLLDKGLENLATDEKELLNKIAEKGRKA